MSRMGRCSDRSAHQQRGECSAASKSGQARSQQLKRCAETTTQEEAAEGRGKRHDSGEARRRRVSSEDGEYTTDDDSDEDERGGAAGAAATSTTAGGGMHSGDPPTRKKASARPRRWQPEEDKKLTLAVKESGEKDWKSIALKVGSRNHVQCLQRWKKVLRPGLVKGQWDAEEDAALMKLATAPFKNWGVLSQSMSGRTSKQCRERWCHHLDPSINKGAYTEEEDKIIIETQAKLGNRWSQIAARLPGRTENSIKIRCKALQRKVLSGSPSSGGRSGSTSSPAGRAPNKSTGTSTTARQSRGLSSSSSSSASESCSSFESGLDTMAEQPPLAPLAVPPRAPLPPEQHPPVHFSRGMHFKLGGGGDGVPLPPAGAPPCHGNSVFSGPGPAAPTPGYAMPRAGLEQGWFEPKQDAAHQSLLLQQQQQQPPGSGSVKVEGGLCALALDRQHHLLQQQKYVPRPEQLVDVIPASQPFPSAVNIDGGGGRGRGGGGRMFANSSDLSPAVEGFLVQPQHQHAQKQTPLMYEYIPSAFPQEGEQQQQQGETYPDHCPQQQQHQQEGGVGLQLDGELMSHAVAAVAAAEDRSAGGVGDGGGAYGICLPEDLACDGGGQRGNGVGQGGDIKPIGGAIGGDEFVNENGPIKECCSFLDLASAASADDNIIGDVDSWRPV